MTTYRIKFRADKEEDHLVEADGVNETASSYRFYDEPDGSTVAQFPKDVVLSITKEKADAS